MSKREWDYIDYRGCLICLERPKNSDVWNARASTGTWLAGNCASKELALEQAKKSINETKAWNARIGTF